MPWPRPGQYAVVMAVTVEAVLGGEAGNWRVRVRHGVDRFEVTLAAPGAQSLVGKQTFVEWAIDSVSRWAETQERSQIQALANGQHRLVGVVEGNMPIGDGTFLYDLFIESGPDYFAIDSTDIGGAELKTGARVAVDVVGLTMHPVSV